MDVEVDILLYVALAEEFETVTEVLGHSFRSHELPDVNLTGFFGNITSPALKRDFRVAVVPAGKMGNTRSANVSSLLIEKLKPADVVVLGIAGSLSNDMEPGDVFIPDSVNEYLANSATSGENDVWTFTTSGNQFPSSGRLLNRFQLISHTHKSEFGSWQGAAAERRAAAVTQGMIEQLAAEGIELRTQSKVIAGDDRKLASGPAVGKGKAFVTWVRGEVDRKIAAMEMESAGVYDAGSIRTSPPRTIAIRGISDFADSRKEKLEKIGNGVFRHISAYNACTLFRTAVEAGLFEPSAPVSLAQSSSVPVELQESRVKSVFVIGGETGETADMGAETPRLFRAAMRLGETLAAAGAQLVVCSPFPDSADYYAAMGYAGAQKGGVIQFHSPRHVDVANKLNLLEQTHGRPGLVVQRWNYPGPETDDDGSWSQSWLFAQLQALERADAVVALGGKVSKSANTLLHLAEAKGMIIVPFHFLGGAAQRAFHRGDWAKLHPDVDTSILASDDGVEQVVGLANRLALDRVRRSLEQHGRPKTVFLSFARQDLPKADIFIGLLRGAGVEVLVGDDQVRDDQLISVSIEQAMLRSDICAVLWSRHYAQSPWCSDELDLSISQQQNGRSGLWLFNLDDSVVVPARARKLPIMSVRSQNSIERILAGLLD